MTVEPILSHLRLRLSRNLFHADESVKSDEGLGKRTRLWSKASKDLDPRALQGSEDLSEGQEDPPVV